MSGNTFGKLLLLLALEKVTAQLWLPLLMVVLQACRSVLKIYKTI